MERYRKSVKSDLRQRAYPEVQRIYTILDKLEQERQQQMTYDPNYPQKCIDNSLKTITLPQELHQK